MAHSRIVLLLCICFPVITVGEMSQEKLLDANSSELQAEHATDLFHIDFSQTGHPLAILTSILLISLMKIVLARFHRVPHSVLLLAFGIIMGFFLSLIFEDEIFLRPSWFFIYLLPLIVLEAGYFLKNKPFFQNIGTICTYAVIGTLFNTTCIALMLFFLRDIFSVPLTFLEIAIFATLISAVDPVAVLCVFEDIHVNDVLYICVFGLIPTITNILISDPERLDTAMYIRSVAQFTTVAFGGCAMGVIGGLCTALVMRLLSNHQAVLPLIMLLMPCFFYLLTDSFHLSGILAIVTCGILVKNYMRGNLCDEMHFTVEYLYKMASSFSESFIFVFLGVSVVSSNHFFDLWFIVSTLVGCFIFRFIGVYLLTFFLNRFRFEDDRISCVDQFVLAYGGIRGAVCYGLVMSIDENLIPAKRMFVTTTLAVIMFTTMIQGTTIKSIVNLLKVKRSKKPEEKRRVFDYLTNEVTKHVIDFIENLTNVHGENVVYRKILEFDQNVLKPKLVAYYRPRNANIIDRHMEIELSEFAMSVKRGTSSFAGFPTNASVSELHLQPSKSELFATGFDQKTLLPPSAPAVSLPKATAPPRTMEPSNSQIPRNVSVTGLVAQAFETTEQQRNLSRGKARRSLYSRHLLETEPPSPTPPPLEDDMSYVMTLPCGKNPRMAAKIRQFGLSLQDRNRNGISDSHRPPITRQCKVNEDSTPRSTNPPPRHTTIPFRFTVEDEDSVSSPTRKKSERTVVGNSKKFTVGEETRELLPIHEEDRDAV
ncbi:Sodium hydrogen exchanger [Parelaphostrongylus tenuis]|uniref:Sodium/hydrogen exchanger n=1 Tax=Parelaphostrongylus tenuis TaxID=148309 RepID=A0AAD5REU1_PARTN|nr:Sodium hydrogen exchanger [Parelaphostrongylus tenuis]